MDPVRHFSEFLQQFIYLTDEEFNQYIKPYLIPRQFKKKQVISPAGEVEDYFNFLVKGLVRKYMQRDKEEIIMQIATEGHIIHAEESFYGRIPSDYTVEAIEASNLVCIQYNDLEKIYSSHPKMERLGRLLVTFAMTLKGRWQMNMIKLNPRERFLNFVQKKPELLQRVPQKFLASFLNIQPETFSRFKHMLKEKVQ